MTKAILNRMPDEGKQTRGILSILEDGIEIFQCVTLELGWKKNRRNVSCIPKSEYIVRKHISPKFGDCFKIMYVPNRESILIHYGNFNRDTHGCILVGNKFMDINKDGLIDILNSCDTLKKLLAIMPDEFKLEIK